MVFQAFAHTGLFFGILKQPRVEDIYCNHSQLYTIILACHPALILNGFI